MDFPMHGSSRWGRGRSRVRCIRCLFKGGFDIKMKASIVQMEDS